MSNIDKQALREAAEEADSIGWDGIEYELDVGPRATEFITCCPPAFVLALLDELEAAEKRIAELQIARDKCFLSGLKTGWEYGIADDTEGYNREIDDAQAVIDRAAGIDVKGE